MNKHIDMFIKVLGERSKSEHTITAYKKDLEQLNIFLTSKNIKDIKDVSSDTLKEYFAKLTDEGWTPKTISRKLNSTKTFFKYLDSINLIDRNPAGMISHPKVENHPPRILSEIEYRALRDAARSDKRTYIIIEILLQTGIRIGELCRIKMKELDLDSRDPSLLISEYGSNTSRSIPLNKISVEMFKEYLNIRPKTSNSDHLFITKNGNPLLIRNVRSSIDNVFKKAGIENAKVNDLRNTFIAHHLSRGTNIFILSKIIGHKRISTTEKYIGKINIDLERITPLPSL
ncbi:tyrosine-type recombinase/integrase [Patescibacteria group bacterium]|nr:tyrosine-type recombinase/integrase [Patescibacteria group bacterium]